MATEISLDDAFGPTAQRKPMLVPADRTSKKITGLSMDDVGGTSDKIGTLPKDRSITDTIKSAAKEFNVPEEYIFALANQESDYDPGARNTEFGAAGIMQYIPASARSRGIDPMDPVASIRAAAKDFAEQSAKGGPEWAIKYHFAGPDTKGHGPKTRQYLADVSKRAKDIRALLDQYGEVDNAGGLVVAGGSDVGPKQTVLSLDEAFGVGSPTPTIPPDEAGGDIVDDAINFAKGGAIWAVKSALESPEIAAQKIGQGWEFIKKRMSDAPDEYLGRKKRQYTRPDGSTGVLIDEQLGQDFPEKPAIPKSGFWANVENPLKLLTEDSLPANFLEAVMGASETERTKFWDARKVLMQENIVANPTQYPKVAVDSARAAIAARKNKQEPSIRAMWDDLKAAATEDSGKFGAVLANALIADPEMLLMPEGLGVRVVSGVRKLTTGAEVASRAIKLGEKVIDAAGTNAALNLAIEETAALSEGRTLTGEEAKQSAAIGAVFGGGLSVLSGVLSKGASAADNLRAGNVTKDTYEQTLRDIAQEELAVDEIVKNPPGFTSKTIEDALGITNMSESERNLWHKRKQAELRKTLADNSAEADYLAFKADERISRRTQLAEEAEGKRTAAEAEAAKQAEVEKAYAETQAQRTTRFATEYEQALEARKLSDSADEEATAMAEDTLRTATAKLDEQEIFEAAMDGDVPAIKRAMASAARRDASLARPKWQRGEVDPRIITRLGVGSLFAGTAFAVAPEDKKLATAFAAGLAGLTIPGVGGNVMRRMRQAGAISADGEVLELARLVKAGKLKVPKAADEAMAAEAEMLSRAKQGNQQAFKELYEEHFPRVARYVNKQIKGVAARLGITAEDVAQEVFVDAFRQLDSFSGEVPFSAYLTRIAKNKAVDAIRDAQTLKGGRDIQTTSMYSAAREGGESFGAGHIMDADVSLVKGEVEDALADLGSPENNAIRSEVEQQLIHAIGKLPENYRLPFLLSRVEQYDVGEVAQLIGESYDNAKKLIQRAQTMVEESLAKGYGAKKIVAKEPVAPVEEVKRGRGRPRKQVGEVDPKLLLTGAGVGAGALLGAYVAGEAGRDAEGNRIEKGEKGYTNPLYGAIAGAGTGALLFAGGAKGLRTIAKGSDKIYGASSTRILNKSKSVFGRIMRTENRINEQTHAHIQKVEPFLDKLARMPKEGRDVLTRALMTGKGAVIDRMLQAFNDPELTAAYKSVRQSLDSLGDQLVGLKRFARGNIEYFPRIVIDKEGLLKAIGSKEASTIQEALEQANIESLRQNGRPLGSLEESAIINQMLFVDRRGVQPGFTKARGIEEITPELQKYYASAGESLHSYIRAAVQDIEAAKFFGTYSRNMKRGKHEYLDVDRSVKNLMAEEVKSGKLSDDDAREIADILRTRFKEGMQSENDTIRAIKNIGNIGLLGNFWSAATQVADVGIQVYTQGLRPTIESVIRQLTGKKIVDMKDFGLSDNISQEFAGELKSNNWVRTAFKYSLFKGVDEFGKNTALNAAVIKAKNLVQTDSGVQRLANKYQEIFGDDFAKLVSELKSGKITELTRDYAFMELSRSQPVSRIEMPEAYLKHPNARSYLWLKSFAMKQVDLVRREAYNEIKQGNVARGIYNLTKLGVILGISGATTDMVKDVMLGKDADFKLTDIPVNMFKTFGFSEYARDQFAGVSAQEAAARREAGEKGARPKKAEPLNAILNNFTPPFRMYQQMLTGDPKSVRYLVPGLGPYLAEQLKKEAQMEQEVQSE